MNDDELNEMLARNDEEAEIFRNLDIQRERSALESWRAAGNRGKPPLGLMQIDELPECYQTDEPFEVETIIEGTEGRGQRKRNTVVYTDGLSDDQWAMALEDGEDLQDLQDRSRRRVTNKLLNDVSGRGTPASDIDSRGRKGKKGKSKMNVPDYDPLLSGKRKRGTKDMSVTPSVNDDDDEDRSLVILLLLSSFFYS